MPDSFGLTFLAVLKAFRRLRARKDVLRDLFWQEQIQWIVYEKVAWLYLVNVV